MSGMFDGAKKAYLAVRGGATLAPMHTIKGQRDTVQAVAFFKDGRRVVTSNGSTLRIWDVEKAELVGGSFVGHKTMVRSVAVSPDNRRIASGGTDGTIIIWDVESKQKALFGPLVKHTDWVRSVYFSPDDKRLASGSDDSTAVIWDAKTGAVLSTLEHRSFVFSVAFSPDGLKLATGSSRTVRVWRTDDSELLLLIDAHNEFVRSVLWSPDGQRLVSASNDKQIKFWNSSTGDHIGQPCTGHSDSVCSLAISSGGSFIATSSSDKTVRLWNAKTHQRIGRALEHTAPVCCVAVSPNGELLVSGDDEGKVLVWSIKNILEQSKVKEMMTDDEKAQRQQLLSRSDMQLSSHDNNNEPTSNNDSSSNHSPENNDSSGSDDKHSLFDVLDIHTTVRNECIAGDLHTAEHLLTQAIDTDDYNHELYSNRSVVRARNSQWDDALQDAVKSIAIQPSSLGYISKGIALCGNERLWDAMEAFDLAFVFWNSDPIIVDLLLLIKAVTLFNANRHDEAMRRVQDLTAACQRSDTLLCNVVNSYLRVQLAIIAFEGGRYSEAADLLNDIIPSITDFFSQRTLFEPTLEIFMVLFGWDLDSLWNTANQRRCDALLRADRVVEAVESHQYMMRIIDEDGKDSNLSWSTAFKKSCTARCVVTGDAAAAAGNYETAIELYSTAIALDSSCHSLFAQRSKAKSAQNLHAEALQDAEKVVKLDPSSYVGYELKYAALHGAKRYDEAVATFKIMLSKLDDSPDAQIRDMRQHYASPSEVEDAIRRAVDAHLENAPLRLLNTFTGRLCDRQAQIHTFKASTEYKELLSSSMKHPHLQTELIDEAVRMYFPWVMLSHRWESKEPLLHDIQDKVVYDLDPVGTITKLQTFCKISRDAGHRWAWSDTCCIDQNNNVELQRSVNSMYVWYHQSALTIVYLSDVPPSAESGALANSVWNTRGWTVQEFLAPNVVLFYQRNWTLYLNNDSPNHKESTTIMQELENSTGINAQALVAFRPGMTNAREKLQWASTRVTTLQEDIAYSLFGIFAVHLPVIYGEAKQNALGRLLQEIVARSGDITALDWVGKSSEFNSCLPADITSYKAPPCMFSSLPEEEMQASVSRLRNIVTVESASTLYTHLNNLGPPRFANSRLQLPCIAFSVTELRRRRGQDREKYFTYDVKADGLDDLLITTEDRLAQFSPARPTTQTFFLICPWNRHDLGLPDFVDDARSVDEWLEPESLLDESLGGYPRVNDPVESESHSRALRSIVRLGQPFGALLLAQQRGGEYKRVASDHNIVARVKDAASVHNMMDIRTLEIL